MGHQIAESLQASVGRVITKIVTLLPGIAAFIVVVLIFWAIAWGLAWLTRRCLTAVRFDARFEQKESLSGWTRSPTNLAVRLVFWIVLVVGILIGLSAFEAGSAELGISSYAIAWVPRIIGALILLFAGTVIARILSRSVLISGVNMNLQYAGLLAAGVKWLVLTLTAAMILDHLDIAGHIVDLAFGILFGGIVLALALSVGLGSRDLVKSSLEREARPTPVPVKEERFHHF